MLQLRFSTYSIKRRAEVNIKEILSKIIIFFKQIGAKIYVFIKKTGLILYGFLNIIKKIFTPFYVNKIKPLLGVMKRWEKITLLLLFITIIVCSIIVSYQSYINNTKTVAAVGGVYIEGNVTKNSAQIDQIVQKLTKIGLTYFNSDGILSPALAEKWEISQDGKTYIFYLRNGVNSHDIAKVIKSHKNVWSDIQIDTPEDKIIKFSLKEPYSPFLAATAEPMFEYGPYTLKKQDKSELVFSARSDFPIKKPYLDELVIKIYPDQENLDKSIEQNKVTGFAEGEKNVQGLNNYSMLLPRYLVAFFNLNKGEFQKKDVRQKVKNNEKLDKDIQATLVTTDKDTNIAAAEELKAKWDKIGLKIAIKTVDAVELQKNIIPNRDYDILLYGIDYGYDPDPYPFWHSSQMVVTGLNLSNFSNQKADALLEEGRQTIDSAVRKEKYQKFQEILNDEVPAIFLEQIVWKYSISDKIHGPKDHKGVTPADRFNEVWTWYTKEKRVDK